MKPLLSTLYFALCVSFVTKAQDEPCDAIQLECNVSAIIGNFDGATYNPDLVPSGCSGGLPFGSAGDIWFKFEADGEQGYLFYSDFNGQEPDHAVILYTGEDCSSLTQVRDCNIDESFHDVFPAGTYYAQVSPRSGSDNDNEYKAGLICSPVPENDERCNATPVSCGNTYTGSFIGSSRTEFVNCYCPVGVGDGGDVWFELNAEPGTTYNIIGQSGQDIEIFETDGCTGDIAQTSLCCISEDILYFSGDGTYYISARPNNLIPRAKLNYQVTIECATPPVNNLPCDAIDVFCDAEPVTGTTVNAGSNESPCLFGGTPPMVWYKFTSDFEGVVELYLCGVAPTFNATASIYTGSCDELTCYDAGGGCISGPESFDVSPGVTYYFAVHGFGGSNEGEFSLTLQCEEDDFCPDLGLFVGDPCDDDDFLTEDDRVTPDCECSGTPIPAGALCENAIEITSNPFFTDYFNPSEVYNPPYYYSSSDIPPFLDSLESDDTSPACYSAYGVVYSFTPDQDRYVDITINKWFDVDPSITILTGCPFTTAHISKGCQGMNKIEDFYALADTTYYILIDGDPIEEFISQFDVNFEMEVRFKKICPELGIQFDSCDDGDPSTVNDIIRYNCQCQGIPDPLAFCSDPFEIIPGPGLTASPILFDASAATPSIVPYCDGSSEERADSWFLFEAVTPSMAVGVKGVGDYDAVLEVFDDCGGSKIACRNANGEGEREAALLQNLNVSQEYLFRVYDTGGNALNSELFKASVTFFPGANVEDAVCNQGSFLVSDELTATIPPFEYPVTKWTWEFTELESPFNVYEFESPNGSDPNLVLSDFMEIEEGRSYSVRVKPAYLNLEVPGDYGNSCNISVLEASGVSLYNESNGIVSRNPVDFTLFPNPTEGGEVFMVFSGLTDERAITIRLFDLTGRQVINELIQVSGQNSQVSLNIGELSPGVYTVSTEWNGENFSNKLFVK